MARDPAQQPPLPSGGPVSGLDEMAGNVLSSSNILHVRAHSPGRAEVFSSTNNNSNNNKKALESTVVELKITIALL